MPALGYLAFFVCLAAPLQESVAPQPPAAPPPRISDLGCPCNPAEPDTMQARQCSLCREAEKQPAGVEIFFLKDVNPRKPNRWLALPKVHGKGEHHLHELTPAWREKLWTAAIAKAKELWGDEWGIAYNGARVRTQCHSHVHIGKLLADAPQGRVVYVDSVADIPVPPGEGVWIAPAGKRIAVHLGEEITETVLLR